jgi:hypothetical protein
MKLVRPYTVTALDSSNVYETPPAAYNGGTTYALGDHVAIVSGTVHTIYKSLQAGNTGNAPASSPLWWQEMGTAYTIWNSGTAYAEGAIVAVASTHKLYASVQGANTNHNPVGDDGTWWLEIGPTNLWAMFDQKTGTQTQWFGEVRAVVNLVGRIDTIALLNLQGSSVNITLSDGVVDIYDEDYSLVSTDGISTLYAYFYEPLGFIRDLVVQDLPIDANLEASVSVTSSGIVKVGSMLFGFGIETGATVYGAQVGIKDYSRIEEDDFGNYAIVQRGYSKTADITVFVERANHDFVYNLLADYRASPVLLIGADGFTSLVQYGLLKDWRVAITYVSHSILDLQFQGI